MSKGDYTAGWYLYDNPNGGLTTEEKTTLDSIYTKSTIIQNGVVLVDGKVDALTTDVAAIPADVWAEPVRTLTSAGAAGATLAEIEGSLILAMKADVSAVDTKVDALPLLSEIESSTILAKESTVAEKLDASAYTAPDNASLLSVKSTVENLPSLSAIENSTVLAKEATLALKLDASSYTAPDNSSIASIKDTVEALPALAAIESSTILAKEATLKGVKSSVDALQ
jgi:hypothetical protein